MLHRFHTRRFRCVLPRPSTRCGPILQQPAHPMCQLQIQAVLMGSCSSADVPRCRACMSLPKGRLLRLDSAQHIKPYSSSMFVMLAAGGGGVGGAQGGQRLLGARHAARRRRLVPLQAAHEAGLPGMCYDALQLAPLPQSITCRSPVPDKSPVTSFGVLLGDWSKGRSASGSRFSDLLLCS